MTRVVSMTIESRPGNFFGDLSKGTGVKRRVQIGGR